MSDITSSDTQWTVIDQHGEAENTEDASSMKPVNNNDAYGNNGNGNSSYHQTTACVFTSPFTGNPDEHDSQGSHEQLEEMSSGSSFEILSIPQEYGGSDGVSNGSEKMKEAPAVASVAALASSAEAGTAEHFEASSSSGFELLHDESDSPAVSEIALQLPFESRHGNDVSSHQCYRREWTTKYIIDMNLQMASDLIRQSGDVEEVTPELSEDQQPPEIESIQLPLSKEGSDVTRKDDKKNTDLDMSLPLPGMDLQKLQSFSTSDQYVESAMYWGFVLGAGMTLVALGMLIHASYIRHELETFRNGYHTCLTEKEKLQSTCNARQLHSQHTRNDCSFYNFWEKMLLQVQRLEQCTEKLEMAYRNSQHEMFHQMEKVVELSKVIEQLKDENKQFARYLQNNSNVEHGQNFMSVQERKVVKEPRHEAVDLQIQNLDAEHLLPQEDVDQGSDAERTFPDESSSLNKTSPSQTLTSDFVSLLDIVKKLHQSATLKVNLSDHGELADELKQHPVFITFLHSLLEANSNSTYEDPGTDVLLTAFHKIDLCLNVLQNLTSQSLYGILSLNWQQVHEIMSSEAFISEETRSGFDKSTNRITLEPCHAFTKFLMINFSESREIKEEKEPLHAFINKTVQTIGQTVRSAMETIKTLPDKFLSESKTEPESSSTFGQKFKDTIKNVNSRFSRGYEKLKEKFNKKFKSSLAKFGESVKSSWKKLNKQVSTTTAWFNEAQDGNLKSGEKRSSKDEQNSITKDEENKNMKDEEKNSIKAEENESMKVEVNMPLKHKSISSGTKEKLKHGIKSVENEGAEVISDLKSESKLAELIYTTQVATKKKKVPTATLR